MSYHLDDTIGAIATASGGAARGMVRLSGPDAVAIAARLFHPWHDTPLEAVHAASAVGGTVKLDASPWCEPPSPSADGGPRTRAHALPCELFLWPGKRSYTREPVAEFHTLGSPPLLEALLAAVCRAGARLAEPGEFTLRAFLAGRLDLTQAEAVLGVIDARCNEDFRGALAQLAGGLARPLHQLREELLNMLADLEAGLDFVDEDIEFVAPEQVRRRLDSAIALVRGVEEQFSARHVTRHVPQVALIGKPNAGKSSLFNELVARHGIVRQGTACKWTPALVAPQQGTTRDYLTATIVLDGQQCELVDTAGINARPASAIDAAAQARAAERRDQAALRVLCVDSSDEPRTAAPGLADCELVVWTKADLAPPLPRQAEWSNGVPVCVTSSRTGEGLEELCTALSRLLSMGPASDSSQIVAATAERCRDSIARAAAALERATAVAASGAGDELLSAELRTAVSELGKVVGAVYTDDLLDRIFSTFCIGK